VHQDDAGLAGGPGVAVGGVKDSGFGRESPRFMVEDYTVVKTLILRGMSIWGEQ
jgi:acyl-CoA reductase-like NAD-dependent aldehyde dehydrogenase